MLLMSTECSCASDIATDVISFALVHFDQGHLTNCPLTTKLKLLPLRIQETNVSVVQKVTYLLPSS